MFKGPSMSRGESISRPSSRMMPQGARAIAATLAVLAGMTMIVGSAQADDLLILNGDSVTLQPGATQEYGIVYIDGGLNLTGNATLNGNSIYIGPDATINSCYVPGATGDPDSACTSGRSLTLNAVGSLTVAVPDGINLTGQTGPNDPGGSLVLTGNPISVTGQITTAGSGSAASGQVTIQSGGPVSVDGIDAPGASVSISASGAINVGANIQTLGANNSDPAGPVTLDSTGGAVNVDGEIQAAGHDGAGPLSGGNGAAVSITGSSVQTEGVQTTGGGSSGSAPGASGAITITSQGALTALGQLDAAGQSGGAGAGLAGAPITLTATGPLTVAGANSAGGQSASGGTISVTGNPVTTGDLLADGGNGSTADAAGGAGGSVTVTAADGASLGSLIANGGGTGNPGLLAPGQGGTVSVTSSGGSISTSSIETQGGYQNQGAGVSGGPITLAANDNLTVGETLNSSGSSANGSSTPPWGGGNAGNVTLDAYTGTLSLGGNATAEGGTGGNSQINGSLGGGGGSGGQVLIVAHAVGPLASLSAAGGAGGNDGDTQGPGGAGGSITAFTNAPIFDDLQLVSSDGGDGNPTGPAGTQQQNQSPTGLTADASTGLISFTSQSPAAQAYNIMMSVAGAAATTALTTSSTSGLHIDAPLCQTVSLTVVAVDKAVSWTSDPSSAVSYLRQPSPAQTCSDAPSITAHTTLSRSLKRLRRAHWVATLRLKLNGVGQLVTELLASRASTSATKHHKRHDLTARKLLLTLPARAVTPGTLTLRVPLPVAARAPGKYTIRLTTTSPDGTRHLVSAVTLEITE